MKNFSLGENVIGEVYESGDEVILYISGTGTAITTRVNHGVGNKKDIYWKENAVMTGRKRH